VSESGTVLGVVQTLLGSTLTASVTAGDTTVYVQDLAYFSPGGGTLTLTDGANEETGLSYTALDEATGAISGLDGPLNAYDQDDTLVLVYPAAPVRYAEVRIDGQQDTVRARVPFALFDRVADGFYADSEGETLRVLVELQDEYVVTDILGTVPSVAVNTLDVLDDLDILGNLTLRVGAQVYVESSVAFEFKGQQSDPADGPLLVQDWETVTNFDAVDSSSPEFTDLLYSERRGAYWDTVDGYILYFGGEATKAPCRRVLPDGTGGTTLFTMPTSYQSASIVRLAGDYYVLCLYLPTYEFRVRKYTTAGVFVSEWTWATWRGNTGPLIYEDGTDLWLAENSDTGVIRSQRFSVAGALLETILTTGFTPDAKLVGCQGNRDFDYGSERHLFITEENLERIRHYDSAGVYSSLRVDAPGLSWTAGLLWDGANFWVLGNGSTVSGVTSSTLYKLEGTYFTGTQTHWLANTWYDSDAAGGNHESIPGPARSYVLRRRKRWTWTVGEAIPGISGDEANSARVYLGQGTTKPANSSFWRQPSGVTGDQSGVITSYLASGSNPPVLNDFPGSDPSGLASGENGTGTASLGTGLGWNLMGNGIALGFADIQVFTAGGANTWNKPMAAGCASVEVIAIAAGGGGGSGRRNGGGSEADGGGGGAGGSIVREVFPFSLFSDGETVDVGVGGAGGAGRVANNNGNDGTAGGDSKVTVGGVAAFLLAKGGAGGAGGTAAAGGAGGASPTGSSFGNVGLRGGIGGDGGAPSATNQQALPRVVAEITRGGGGGGAGGGGVTAGGSTGAGADGATVYDLSGGAGASGSTDPGAGAGKLAGYAAPGSGGGGSGGRASVGATRAGGAGGLYGGGGGGSGGGQGQDSGDGGAGAAGIVVIICR